MRRLMILRHAKAERLSDSGRDMDRPLAPRGREDAARIGSYMARHGLLPDRVVISTAKRTNETWTLVTAALSATPAIAHEERLYNAKPETILKVIRDSPAQAHSVCVIAHNPGLHQLALLLIGAGDNNTRERLAEKLPTAALVVIDFAVDAWDKLQPHHGRLDRFVTPRALDSED